MFRHSEQPHPLSNSTAIGGRMIAKTTLQHIMQASLRRSLGSVLSLIGAGCAV